MPLRSCTMKTPTQRRFTLPLLAIAASFISFSCAPAVHAEDAPATPPTVVAPADPQVLEALDKLEKKGKEIASLQAKVRFQKHDVLLGDETRIGEIVYIAENAQAKQPTRFAIDFNTLILDDVLREDKRQYIFDGIWLVEKQFARKMFQKRQILAPGEKFNPLDMDGPFPVPLGQKRADVLARFDVKVVPSTDAEAKELKLTAPPLHLHLTPRAGAPGKVKFAAIDLWFDSVTLLPVMVHAVEPAPPQEKEGNATKVWLTDLKLNAETPEALTKRINVDVPPAAEGWNVDIARQP